MESPAPASRESVRTRTIIILIICLVARLGLFVVFQPWDPVVESDRVLWRDAADYHQLATTLLEAHRFAYTPTGRPDALRTPIYPGFVALVYSMAGYRPWVVILVQVLLDTLSCFVLFLALSRVFGRTVGLVAAGFYSLEPFLILYSAANLVSDSLFLFLLVLTLYFLVSACRDARAGVRPLDCALSGLFLGLATLTRPVSVYAPVCILGFLVAAYWRHAGFVLKSFLLVLLVFAVTLAPWLYRNEKTFGSFGLSTSGSYNLLVLDVAPMEMRRRHQDRETVKRELLAEADRMAEKDGLAPDSLNRFQSAKYWKELATTYIKRNPAGFARGYMLGVFDLFANLGTTNYGRVLGLRPATQDMLRGGSLTGRLKILVQEGGTGRLAIAILVAAYLFVAYVGAGLGILAGWRRFGWRHLLLILLFSLYFVLVTGPAGLARFKLPVIPFYLALTAVGYCVVYWRVAARQR